MVGNYSLMTRGRRNPWVGWFFVCCTQGCEGTLFHPFFGTKFQQFHFLELELNLVPLKKGTFTTLVVKLIRRPTTTHHHNKQFVTQGFLLPQQVMTIPCERRDDGIYLQRWEDYNSSSSESTMLCWYNETVFGAALAKLYIPVSF